MTRSITLLFVALAAGCFARNASEPRFFRPESALLRGPAPDAARVPDAKSVVAIRVRAVDGGPFLRERIVWRTSSVEYGLYEQRRWREVPATYVAHAITAALRQTASVRVSDEPGVPSLRVEVVAFDEVLTPTHVAVVEVTVSLRTKDGQRLFDRSFAAETPIAGDDPVAMAHAMGHALDDVASHVAAAVASADVGKSARGALTGTGKH
jgi:uncharacterized lipoprotein YmbA